MRRVEPDPDESRRKLWRAENSLATHARCSPPGLSRIASLIGKIQACRPVDHSSGANGCFSSCGGNAHPDREWQLATLLSHSERDSFAALAQSPQFEHELSTSARPQRTALLDADPLFWDVPETDFGSVGRVYVFVARVDRFQPDLVANARASASLRRLGEASACANHEWRCTRPADDL